MESTTLRDFLGLSRLTLAVSYLYVWLISVGGRIILAGLRHLIDRHDRHDLNIFQTGSRVGSKKNELIPKWDIQFIVDFPLAPLLSLVTAIFILSNNIKRIFIHQNCEHELIEARTGPFIIPKFTRGISNK